MFAATRKQEEDTELFETVKVSKFYEMVCDKGAIAMPVAKGAKSDAENCEQWPIIQAYGLDSK